MAVSALTLVMMLGIGLGAIFYRQRQCVPNKINIPNKASTLTLGLKTAWEISFLPPASEGWGKVIFSVCPHLWGHPVPGLDRGAPSHVWTRGTPSCWQGDTPSRTGWGILIQGWMGYSPPSKTGWGTHLSKTGWGTPPSSPGWGKPPSRTGWGTPPTKTG